MRTITEDDNENVVGYTDRGVVLLCYCWQQWYVALCLGLSVCLSRLSERFGDIVDAVDWAGNIADGKLSQRENCCRMVL